MKKFLFVAFSVFTLSIIPNFVDAQTKISLLPTTMRKYIGKIKKADWEKSVGSPNISDFPHATYEVANTHTRQYTDISCKYRKADSVLIEVHYPSKISWLLGGRRENAGIFQRKECKILGSSRSVGVRSYSHL